MQNNKLELINYFISIGVTSGSWPKRGCSSPNLPNILTGWGWVEVAGHESMIAYQQGSLLSDIIKLDSNIALTVGEYSSYLAAKKSAVTCYTVESWSKAFTPQPQPNGQGNPVLGYVLADLTNRALVGKEKYGEPLKVFNGRRSVTDLLQELYDGVMYAKQLELELEDVGNNIADVMQVMSGMESMNKSDIDAAVKELGGILQKFTSLR